MIIKTRRKNESMLKRLFKRATSNSSLKQAAHILPQEIFETELVKKLTVQIDAELIGNLH